MIFIWKLKSTESNKTIDNGEIEANTQDEAIKLLNEEKKVHPHIGEILEIIPPYDTSINGDLKENILK